MTQQDERFREGRFTNACGTIPYRLFIPARRLGSQPALVLMLHGCTQSPEDFAIGTRMNTLAETHGFLALYPEQTPHANPNRCWNWFRAADQIRDQGEPGLITGLVRQIATTNGCDRRRIFAAGLSAGGAATATLGALYPDLFAAIGVHSGLAHGAASDMPSAFMAMRQGRPGHGRIDVPTIVFHGDADTTVNFRNGDAVAAQALPRTARPAIVSEGERHTRTAYSAGDGRWLLEHWIIHGGAHAWSGGDPAGSFADAQGPDASQEMLRFFFAR